MGHPVVSVGGIVGYIEFKAGAVIGLLQCNNVRIMVLYVGFEFILLPYNTISVPADDPENISPECSSGS
ncbi:hypothetical protein TNCT_610261 [Trichonephila clavata]|uniref:Uncharacterized protein n=1 Tax=Trichonephila clavata TaxID=2740835 RepID=A0A8X6HIY0_TRICU|nr:hypothetical protein TNCT_610261 [Trichonephila clavata]